MKQMLINLVAAALLLVATQAFAATMWEAISDITTVSRGQDITRLTVTDTGTSFVFDMYLLGQPVARDASTQYNVYIGSAASLPSDPNALITSSYYKVLTRYSPQTGYVTKMVDLSDPNNPVQKTLLAIPQYSNSLKRLEWVISKNDITSVPYFMGTTENTTGIVDHTSVAATPIPAAVWLFVSGILCLIGLKRRM